MKTVLVFESWSGGHRKNFLHWLAQGIQEQTGPDCRFVFVVPACLEGPAVPGLTFDPIPEATTRELMTQGTWGRRFTMWRLCRDACARHAPDHVLLMDLTQMEWPLLLLGFSVPFSSILFVQYPEISNPVKRVLKALKTACLLRRVPCSHLFLLNGEHSCGRLNQKWGHRTRFVPIPDPVDLSTRPEPSWPQSPTPDRLRFLYFGTISNHKGFDLLVEAMLRLSTDDVNASLFVISGKPYEPKAFEETVDKLRNAPNQVRFELNTSFLPETEMLKVFYESDVVLLPYRRAEYSSGVLGLSAMTGRPVIGPDSGLMGRIIREHRLGKTIDLSAGNLAEAISHTIQNGIDYDPAQGMRYASHCSPRMFSRHILDHLKDKIATPGPVPHAPPDTKKDFFHA